MVWLCQKTYDFFLFVVILCLSLWFISSVIYDFGFLDLGFHLYSFILVFPVLFLNSILLCHV